MTKIAIAVLLCCAVTACVEGEASELGRPCAVDPCDATVPGMQCVTFAAPVGEEAAICATPCASPEADGVSCADGAGVCATGATVDSAGGVRERSWCVPACAVEDGSAACPAGLYPRSSGAACACLP